MIEKPGTRDTRVAYLSNYSPIREIVIVKTLPSTLLTFLALSAHSMDISAAPTLEERLLAGDSSPVSIVY